MIGARPAPGDLRPNPDWTGLPIFDRRGWRRVRFGDVVKIVKETADPNSGELDRYIAGEHMDSEHVHLRRWGTIGDGYLGPAFIRRFRKGQVLYGSRRTYLKKVAYAEFDGITANTTFVLEAIEGKLYQPLLPWIMLSERFTEHSIKESKGSTNPYINWPDLAKFEFDLPPLDQQRRIAEVLWAVDETIHKITAVREAAGSAIEADLADFIYNGENWPRICCRELLAEGPKNGFSPKITRSSDGQPTLSISAIRDGKVITEGNLKYADLKPDEVGQYILYPNDILVVRGNGNRLLCGRAGIVETTPTGCFYPDLLIRIRFRTDALLPKFAVLQWNERGTHMRLLSKAKSTNGIWKINGKDIQAHELAVPPISKQQRYLDSYTRASTIVDDLQNQENATANLLRVLINTVVA
ncbi:MAG: hypothetical protein CVV35_09905 [Methanomicrobiales archaeon HGW-Methanomicrobiales-6]|jgi:type I restriction enzyme S subunit|nr:MAG: hypothetical protein CVV35_09905 [Methanomicrobiales archaeon HGW-Methanomicrobiales-6]